MGINEDLTKLEEKYGMSTYDILKALKAKTLAEDDKRIEDKIKSNESLVGRCFIGQKLHSKKSYYYKVISAKSSNEYRVECLIFPVELDYSFRYQAHKLSQPGDFLLGNIESRMFFIDSILASDFQFKTEITETEFNIAARDFLEKVLESQWGRNDD